MTASPTTSATELLAHLVAFDTTSHKSNVPLIRFKVLQAEKHLL